MVDNAQLQPQVVPVPVPQRSESDSPRESGATKFIIRVPKDQIYKVPPPENAKRYADYTRRKTKRSRCHRCLCWMLFIVLIAVVLIGIVAGALYLIFRPQIPDYSIERISVAGFNSSAAATKSTDSLRLRFSLAVRAENPNEKISVEYERPSSVRIRHLEADLCDGEMPYFRQPARNMTVIRTNLEGTEIVQGGTVYDALLRHERAGAVPLKVRIEAPMRMRIGGSVSWRIGVVVKCEVTLDKVAEEARIVTGDCRAGMKMW